MSSLLGKSDLLPGMNGEREKVSVSNFDWIMALFTLLAEPFFCLLDFGVFERDCMNRVRSLLNMRYMLPGYSLEPHANVFEAVIFAVMNAIFAIA